MPLTPENLENPDLVDPPEESLTELEEDILGRHIAKPDDTEKQPIILDDVDRKKGSIISSQTFQAAGVCTVKAQGMLYETDALPSSEFSKENQKQGHIFESKVFKISRYWVPKINKVFDLELPFNIPIVDCSIAASKRHTSNDLIKMSIEKTKKLLLDHIGGGPVIFRQVALGNTDFYGKADMVIYTGGSLNSFIVGDIKRSENVLKVYGIQLFFYRDLLINALAELLDEDKETTVALVRKEGVILHYARGYTFSTNSSLRDQDRCFQHLLVENLELPLLDKDFDLLIENLLENTSNAPEWEKCSFTYHCIECSFRNTCYPIMLNNGTDISLVPMDGSLLENLKSHGINTAEELAKMPPTDRLLIDLLEKKELVEALLERAKIATHLKGFSDWSFQPGWLESAWFFVRFFNGTTYEERWQDPEGEHTAGFPDCPEIRLVVVLTEHERKHVISEVLKYLGQEAARKLQVITLMEDIHNYVHLPLPSYSITSLALFFNTIREGESPKETILNWFDSRYAESEVACKSVEERLKSNHDIWLGLIFLSEQKIKLLKTS